MNIIRFSIKRKVTIAMFSFALILFGLVSFQRLNMNLLPEINYPRLVVETKYLGSTPKEVENQITNRIEESLSITRNLIAINSISSGDLSRVELDFDWGTEMDIATIEIREMLDRIDFPEGTERPRILSYDSSLDPIIRFAFYPQDTTKKNQKSELERIRTYLQNYFKKELEVTSGIAAIRIDGGYDPLIKVNLDFEKMQHYQISLDVVQNALQQENINMSGGKIEEKYRSYRIRCLNEYKNIHDIKKAIIKVQNNRVIKLEDIATVYEDYEEPEVIIRAFGKESVAVNIYKEGDANIVKASKKFFENYHNLKIPDYMSSLLISNQAVFIEQAIGEVINAAIVGTILAVIILYLFMGKFIPTMIISLAIPISIITTFSFMHSMDVSLNIMSLGGITLGLGMLLDNSIVVLENINRFVLKGYKAKEAALLGASEVGQAVFASTLTSIAVFAPLIFIEGVAGQLFSDQAFTVTFSLLVSLVVSLSLIPTLSALEWQIKPSSLDLPSGWKYRLYYWTPISIIRLLLFPLSKIIKILLFILNPIIKGFNLFYDRLVKFYTIVLRISLEYKLQVLFVMTVILSMSIFLLNKIDIELIPSLSQKELRLEITTKSQDNLSSMDKLNTSLSIDLLKIKGISKIFSSSGSESGISGAQYDNSIYFVINTSVEVGIVAKEIRDILKNYSSIEKYNLQKPALFNLSQPLAIEILGKDIKQMEKRALSIIKELKNISSFKDINSNIANKTSQIEVVLDRNKVAYYGLNMEKVAYLLKGKIQGVIPTYLSRDNDKIGIRLKSRLDFHNIDDIENIKIVLGNKKALLLKQIADIKMKSESGKIYHSDSQRMITITMNIEGINYQEARNSLISIINQTKLPETYANLSGQDKNISLAFSSLKFALALAIFLVYLVMASLFESFFDPLIIIFSIPLAFIGSVFALYITNSNISIVVFIGAILLCGIVVNNAIVLLDLIKKNHQSGKYDTISQAIFSACQSRLRAVLMTTFTTILGLLPMALGLGAGANIRTPMAITVIGGLLSSTLLTLVIIPVIYDLFHKKGK